MCIEGLDDIDIDPSFPISWGMEEPPKGAIETELANRSIPSLEIREKVFSAQYSKDLQEIDSKSSLVAQDTIGNPSSTPVDTYPNPLLGMPYQRLDERLTSDEIHKKLQGLSYQEYDAFIEALMDFKPSVKDGEIG